MATCSCIMNIISVLSLRTLIKITSFNFRVLFSFLHYFCFLQGHLICLLLLVLFLLLLVFLKYLMIVNWLSIFMSKNVGQFVWGMNVFSSAAVWVFSPAGFPWRQFLLHVSALVVTGHFTFGFMNKSRQPVWRPPITVKEDLTLIVEEFSISFLFSSPSPWDFPSGRCSGGGGGQS